MRFLCVKCDQQMGLHRTSAEGNGGSLTLVFSCPDCNAETAMMTNPGETQLVRSLGVDIGPASGAGRCPFGASLGASPSGETAAEEFLSGMSAEQDSGIKWSVEARQRLENVPDMVRPMAKMGIERFAKEQGYSLVDIEVLDKARESFGI